MNDIPKIGDIVVAEIKRVYVAWTNTDLTEGRGKSIPLAVCYAESTARRLGRRGDVQGGDCEVTEAVAVRLERSGLWLGPCNIHYPSHEDEIEEKRLEDRRQAEVRKQEALERAKEAGLSDEDIEILKGKS